MNARSSEPLGSGASRRLGQVVGGKYELLDLLGSGGMSSVYAASHRNGLAVAIKVLHDELASDESVRRWFLREAYLANRVNHRGAVRVLDDDVMEDGAAYLVIERLYGDTLRAIWERAGRKLPAKEVALFAYDVLDVLAAAHARGIVHRDVKPENLFITDEGEVKVLDFGIAHPLPVMGEAAATTTLRVAGTPAYMAPEQTRGVARAETDVWGVGATMFALITGEYVHSEAPPPDLLAWAGNRPARSVGTLARDLPSDLAAVIDRALAFEPEQRFATAHAMRSALGDAFASAFGVSVGDARSGVLAELRAREPVVARAARRADVHSVATRVPKGAGHVDADAPLRTGTPGAAVTRTLAEEVSPAPRRSRHWRVALGAIAAMSALGAAIIIVSFPFNRRVPAPPSLPLSDVDDLAVVADPAHIPQSALADYRAGVQLWRDASSWDAVDKFASAAKSAPQFAAAHLWYLIATNYVMPSVREHFASAVLGREALKAGQLELLDAFGPSMADPSNLAETADRIEALVTRHPENADLRVVFALVCERLGDTDRGLAALREPRAGDTPALASYARALLYSLHNDPAAVAAALDECTQRSVLATDCLYDQWQLTTNEGRCQELEPICRHLIVVAPSSSSPFDCLADALYSSGGAHDDLQAAFQEQLKRIPSDASVRTQAEHATELAIAEGRLEDAARLVQEWQTAADDYKNSPLTRSAAIDVRIELDVELGRNQDAAKVARQFASASKSWPRSDFEDTRAETIYDLSAAGVLSAKDRATLRAALIAESAAPSYGRPWRRWYNSYVITAWSSDEARLAIANMPTNAIHGPDLRNAEEDFFLGRVFLLADAPSRALPFFTRAARSCGLTDDLYRTRAKLQVGTLSEGTADVACGLYSELIEHWKSSPKSATVVSAKLHRDALHCSASHLTQ